MRITLFKYYRKINFLSAQIEKYRTSWLSPFLVCMVIFLVSCVSVYQYMERLHFFTSKFNPWNSPIISKALHPSLKTHLVDSSLAKPRIQQQEHNSDKYHSIKKNSSKLTSAKVAYIKQATTSSTKKNKLRFHSPYQTSLQPSSVEKVPFQFSAK